MLRWISEQAKWIIYISFGFIVVGLLFMGNGKTGPANSIAEVDGSEISLTEYQKRLEYRENQYAGQNLKDEDRVALRREVLNEIIQGRELRKEIEANGLYASSVEMFADLKNNPPAEWKNAEIFATNGAFDQAKYEAWLSNDSIYDNAQIRQYEELLKLEKIPMKQLENLVGAGFRSTNLEAKFNVVRRDTRFRLKMVKASIDSFNVPISFATPEKVKAYFEANADSFVTMSKSADYKVLTLSQVPSARDEENALKYATFIVEQARGGADFAMLATENSEDKGSAKNGGELGGYNAADVFVKEFSDAAFALDSGAISAPVKTQFGYHIIKSEGKIVEEGIEKAKLAHVLIKVSVGTETIDSLRAILEDVKKIAEDKGLEEAAKGLNLKLDTLTNVAKGGPLGKFGFFMGVESYTFKAKQSEAFSEVLQNEGYFALIEKIKINEAGSRDLAANKAKIELLVTRAEQKRLAKEYLESKVAEIKGAADLDAYLAQTSKLSLDSSSWVSLDSYIPTLGFANPNTNSFFALNNGDWSGVIEADRNVVLAQVVEKSAPDDSQIKMLISSEIRKSKEYLGSTLFNEWVKLLPRRVEVKDELYEFYSM